MANVQNPKRYNLEERTLEFGKGVIRFSKELPKNTVNTPLIDQFVRSGTSLGSNYREANETETKRDFAFRMRICRKEAKETIYWLEIILEANPEYKTKIDPLIQESTELLKIFAAIILKTNRV